MPFTKPIITLTEIILYVEPQPDVIFPEALWICGTGFGRPSAPYEVTSSWNWNTPFDYAPARLVSDGVYQVTIYGQNTDGGSGFGTLDFKFFYKRGWWDAAHEIDAAQYTVTAPFFGRTDDGKYRQCKCRNRSHWKEYLR